MPRCRLDKSIERKVINGFDFPLGVYPIETMTPREGYTLTFEAADGGGGVGGGGGGAGAGGDRDESDTPEFDIPGIDDDFDPEGSSSGRNGDLEAWPDRYVWDVVIRASRVEAMCRALFALLPGRIYPILDFLGSDAYREIDPYVAYDLVGQERFIEGLRLFRSFLFEDGLIGFGAMSDEPFLYVFIDEHKIVTIRAESAMKERIESVLAAFDLQEIDEIAGADGAPHEHRSVIEAPDDRPDLLTPEEIVEELKEMWGLSLNIDGERNLGEHGEPLGICGWRCVLRGTTNGGDVRYVEVLVTADCLNTAQDLSADAAEHVLSDDESIDLEAEVLADEDMPVGDLDIVSADRFKPEDFTKYVREVVSKPCDMTIERVWAARRME